MQRQLLVMAALTLGLSNFACSDDTTTLTGSGTGTGTGETGDGDGDGDPATGDGDGDPTGDGDGDGDPTGDGDGDPTGDGDGDPTGDGDGDPTGDGDGDPTGDGDGDGDPSSCGDGVVDMGEECDLGEDNADDGACTNSCALAFCGDGLVYADVEACDDGNELNTDACVDGCVAATCEDGFVFEGSETDVDCGGDECAPCEVGFACIENTDCVSNLCEADICELDILSATITIINEGDVDLAEWQVPVDLTAQNFVYADAAPDGADIRMSSDGVNADLPYWIESWVADGDSRVWVKVPAIPANGSVDIYLTYGDPDLLDASDGDETFEFFDAHEDDDYMDKWTAVGAAAITEANGGLELTGNSNWSYAASQTTFDYEIEVHTELFAGGQSSGLAIIDDDTDLRYTFRATNGNTGVTWDADVNGGNSWENTQYPGVTFTQNAVRRVTCALRLSGDQVEVVDYCNAGECSDGELLSRTPFSGVRVGISNYNLANGPVRSDLMFVTKHTTADVSATVN